MTLSDKQNWALQTTWATLQVVIAFAESISGDPGDPGNELLSQTHAELARNCQRKILEAFPELTVRLERWFSSGVGQ